VGDTVVTVLTLPLGYTLREPDAEHWGIRLTLPASLALGSFDLYNPALDQIDDINLAAWSVLPGSSSRSAGTALAREPFANVGWAQERETRGGAALYQAGVSTLYAVPEIAYPEIAIGARYLYAGYRSEGADSEPISMAALGLGATFPTHGRSPMDARLTLVCTGSAGTTSATCASACRRSATPRSMASTRSAWSWACDRL